MRRSIAVLGLLLLAGCERPPAPTPQVEAQPIASAAPSASASAASATPNGPAPIADADFGALVNGISEPEGTFPSDNWISNETSYLHVERGVAAHRGGTYLGVGPEQNFTYLALARPDYAFLLDIRRENLLLHLVYKTIFEHAETRGDFLAELCSRPTVGTPDEREGVEGAIAFVNRMAALPDLQRRLVQRTRDRMKALGVQEAAGDLAKLERIAKAFADEGTTIHYRMEGSSRRYPTLAELVTTKDDDGREAGFLGTVEAFRAVRRMQRENRVIPVVADLSGDQAMPRLAKAIADRGSKVEIVYVSNVEQYVFDPAPWKRWLANLDALPQADDAEILRVYFDQGKAHPNARAGHRTTSMLVPLAAFTKRARERPYKSWFEVATDAAPR